MKKIIILFFVLFFTFKSVAMSESITGNQFLALNENQRLFYAVGFTDGWQYVLLLMGKDIPQNITYKQVSDVLYKYIALHPENRNESLSFLALTAMGEAFPVSSLRTLK